jgi:hypothetical protein
MSAAIIGVVFLIVLVGLGVGLYFFLNGKKCKDYETQDECKEPCQWDTYGYKCVDEDDDLTPAPPAPADDSETSQRESQPTELEGTTQAPSGNKWKCYAGRYGDAYEVYKANKSLDEVKEHYDTIGKSKGWKTSCTLSPDELGCYTLQNPEVFDNFGYTLSTRSNAKHRKHYKDVGRDEVARFNCEGGQLGDSTFGDDEAILTPREINIDRRHRKYTYILTSPNGEYSLALYHERRRGRFFLRKGNSNRVTILDSQLSQADYEAGYTKLRAWLSGYDGNLYMRWYKPNGSGGHKAGKYINQFAPGTTYNQTKSNQHVLVLTDTGKLYVDHGLGADEQRVIVEGDE